MNFRLEFPSFNFNFEISHQDKIFMIGSCFSEEIAEKLIEYKFQVLQNPFGIIFHPLAIENIFKRIIYQESFKKDELEYFNEMYFSWEIHSKLSEISYFYYLSHLNKILLNSYNFLKETKIIFITLGTSFVYELIKNQKIVANCHKFPSKNFNKKILSENQIIQSLERINLMIKNFNPNAKIIYTISPVRHIKDGIIENNVSKARLLSSVYEVQNLNENINYFPSYELILDDLRDYRFFKEDLIHPNNFAINYIWERFSNVFFNEQTKEINQEIIKINKSLKHKPLNSESKGHKNFLKILEEKIKNLQSRINFLFIYSSSIFSYFFF